MLISPSFDEFLVQDNFRGVTSGATVLYHHVNVGCDECLFHQDALPLRYPNGRDLGFPAYWLETKKGKARAAFGNFYIPYSPYGRSIYHISYVKVGGGQRDFPLSSGLKEILETGGVSPEERLKAHYLKAHYDEGFLRAMVLNPGVLPPVPHQAWLYIIR